MADSLALTLSGIAILAVAVPLLYAAVSRRRLSRPFVFAALATARSLFVALAAGLAAGVWLGLAGATWQPLPWACWLAAVVIFALECHATSRHFGRFG